tara:strand:+ start:297 stop:773 length:477 start_codon:yes stop_codon:yes gene_type:complete
MPFLLYRPRYSEYGLGMLSPVKNMNNTTKVGSKNAGYTIVASVRMHSDAFEDGLEEDMTLCLGVNAMGSMVSWKAYHTEERLKAGNIGWCSGSYQPNRQGAGYKNRNILMLGNDENSAIKAFEESVAWEMKSCISRAKTVANSVGNEGNGKKYGWSKE